MKKYTKLLLILILPLLLIMGYALAPGKLTIPEWTIEKADFSDLTALLSPTADSLSADSLADSTLVVVHEEETKLDTASHRILFFGDSMTEGLLRRFKDYAEQNGHELTNVCWYSSSTKLWAETDTLQHFLRISKPTFVVICLGGNEMFVRDLDRRTEYVETIVRQVQHVPYVWIGTPRWKDDTGLCQIIEDRVGTRRYYHSERLTLERGKDHIHPTWAAASVWMDSIAVWMQSMDTQHPIRMEYPEKKAEKRFPTHVLQPMK